MSALGLKAVIRRKRPNYVRATETHIAENVMNRDFQATVPNIKWCTDVTELKYGNGQKSYLSAILDVYDNAIVSWVFSQPLQQQQTGHGYGKEGVQGETWDYATSA
jgi:putative transposase